MIRDPKPIKEYYGINRKQGLTFGPRKYKKEMTNLRIESEKIGGVSPAYTRKGKNRPRYEQIGVHMIFEINIDGKFTRKAGLISDVHTTAPTSPIKYSIFFPDKVLGLHS